MTVEISSRGFARLLWRLADLVRVAETRRSFRSKAYRSAVWAIDDLPGLDVSDEQLLGTPGIGPGVTALIHEYRSSGGINQLIPLEEAFPREAPRLRRLPRITPKMLRDLKSLGIETTSDLIGAIESGAAATVRGAGKQTLELWRRILQLPPRPDLVPSHEGWAAAMQLAVHVADHTSADVHVAGAVRRVEEWVDRIDLVAISDESDSVTSFLTRTATLSEHTATPEGFHNARTHSGLPVEIHIAPPTAAGSALFTATGPPEHVIGLGMEPSHASEGEIYRAAGIGWIPPPARVLPVEQAGGVVTLEDLRGDLHLHSEDSPDGRMTLDTILQKATTSGYDYVLMTDHTVGLRFGGLSGQEISSQSVNIERLRIEYPRFTIFHGAELNIMKDGTLDLDDEALEPLDFAVAGVHSYFGLDRDTQTKRVIAALEHPVVKVLAHPFGRRIGIRPSMGLDMDAIIDAAVEQGVALETNGHRDRLDLPSDWIEIAAERGALFAANSDAHRPSEMDNIANAVATLQRAGVTPDRVVNTWTVEDLSDWVNRAGKRGSGGEGGI
jgi:DNA polymerase (family 10)